MVSEYANRKDRGKLVGMVFGTQVAEADCGGAGLRSCGSPLPGILLPAVTVCAGNVWCPALD
jgi:hypothetical protein